MNDNDLRPSQIRVKEKFTQKLKYLFYEDSEITEVVTGARFSKYYCNLPVDDIVKLNEYKSDFAVLTDKCSNVEFSKEKEIDKICIYAQNEEFNEKDHTYFNLVNSDEYKNSKAVLPIPAGIDFYGKTVVADLRELAYLMCVGFVGSGISEFLEGMILSLTKKYAPNQFKVMLIEPKNFALKTFDVFEGLPHLLGNKIFKTEQEIFDALDAVVREIERRNDLLSKMGAPTIDIYNNSEAVKNGESRYLPYVVVVMNKFDNVISINQTKVEKYIQILTGKAKACGVNLVIATEKPTDDVLTPIVLKHVLSRLFFKIKIVSSKYLSLLRQAEYLFANGDMYLVPYPSGELQRLQYGYISYNDCKDEVAKIIDLYKK